MSCSAEGGGAAALRIEGLDLHYGAAQSLFGVSLEVRRGETVALVGANGAVAGRRGDREMGARGE